MDAKSRARLAQAYRQTDYRVNLGGHTIALRVGDPWAALARSREAGDAPCFAYLTAVNPASRRLGAAENEQRLAALHDQLVASGYLPRPGVAVADDGKWPDERGWLAFGMPREAARALARIHGQNAFLFGTRDGQVELVWADENNSAGDGHPAG